MSYLEANPDVRDAVQAGKLGSGWQHYEKFGRAERRPLRGKPRLDRREKLVGGLDLRHMVGIEIGALADPIVHKHDGSVFYIDHADTDTLKRKYAGWDRVADIVPVDAVWGEQTLQDCIGAGQQVDYVVNSHVVEHVPDLVTWLQEIRSVLKPYGELRMAIPDRRFTFDFLRRESTLADVLDCYVRRARAPTPRAILDHFLNYAEIDAAKAWSGELKQEDIKPTHEASWALEVADQAFRTGVYQDTHCWVFTPRSFIKICRELAKLGLLNLSCSELYPTELNTIEFFVRMRNAQSRSECVESWQVVTGDAGD